MVEDLLQVLLIQIDEDNMPDGRHDSSPKVKPNPTNHHLAAGCSIGQKTLPPPC